MHAHVFPIGLPKMGEFATLRAMQTGSSKNQNKAFIVFDIETTGFRPEQGHEILEIAAEKLEDGTVVARFHTLVKPERPIPEESIAIHGITQDLVDAQGRDAREALQDFFAFASDAVLVGHNVSFDVGFVKAYAKKFGFPDVINQTLDTCEIARRQLIIPQYSLDRVAQHFGITNTRAHRAQSDVEVTRKVFLKLLERALASRKEMR